MKKSFRDYARAFLPWVISGGLLAYVLIAHDMAAVIDSFSRARLLPFLGLMLVFVVFWLFTHSLFLLLCLRWFVAAYSPDPDYRPPDPKTLTFTGMMRACAASYVLHIISFVVGLGGLVVYFNRRYGVAYRRGTAVMLMSLLNAFCALGALAFVAVKLIPPEVVQKLGHGDVQHQLDMAASVGLSAVGFYALCLISARLSVFLPEKLLADETVFTPFVYTPLHSYPVLLLIYLLQMASYGVFVILAMPAFGLHPPALATLALTQVVSLARGLPISSLGIGLDQVTFTYLFQGLGDDGAILAFSMAYTFSQIAFRFVIGLPFFTHATREMFEREGEGGKD